MVGDRGTITSARIAALKDLGGIGWLTALRAPQIAALAADDGPLQMSLFDEQNFAEITHPDYPGERLVACRNPLLAAERARKRGELLVATEAALAPIIAAVNAGRLAGVKRAQASVITTAPPERVWEVLLDHEHMSGWSPFTSSEIASPGSAGGQAGVVRKLSGGPGGLSLTETIVAAEQPYRMEYKAEGAPLQWKYHGFVTLEPTSGGGTTITWEAQFRSPVPGSGMITSATLRSLAKGLAGAAEKAHNTNDSPTTNRESSPTGRLWRRERCVNAGRALGSKAAATPEQPYGSQFRHGIRKSASAITHGIPLITQPGGLGSRHEKAEPTTTHVGSAFRWHNSGFRGGRMADPPESN